jgi:hypothetical protein
MSVCFASRWEHLDGRRGLAGDNSKGEEKDLLVITPTKGGILPESLLLQTSFRTFGK